MMMDYLYMTLGLLVFVYLLWYIKVNLIDRRR